MTDYAKAVAFLRKTVDTLNEAVEKAHDDNWEDAKNDFSQMREYIKEIEEAIEEGEE